MEASRRCTDARLIVVRTGVTILHKGTEVLVGSGFTVEQRIRYAQHPEAILGKEITVQCE